MIYSLDEAIKHCEEVAEKNEKECKNWAYGASQINDDESRKKQYLKHAEMWKECAKEHRQLAKWLKELKERREIQDILLQFIVDIDLDTCCEELVNDETEQSICEENCNNQTKGCWIRWAKMKAREAKVDE
jgi:hypothetical protein